MTPLLGKWARKGTVSEEVAENDEDSMSLSSLTGCQEFIDLVAASYIRRFSPCSVQNSGHKLPKNNQFQELGGLSQWTRCSPVLENKHILSNRKKCQGSGTNKIMYRKHLGTL
ncbi:hypothetical protein BB560_002073 [Smittium megazygosporum]|uniref:Uncharacterized protein n=1 Tax=Smittium megazygosporum TaxID=133381 RepID=A0A2T9ZFV1_9FUNG|nr:hypothetical protein BB560_002075 [Smittium megazygosporum]PVV03445.1 hypothetical protein BB560_002073 [Smittium megazygosporum]